MKVAKEQNKIIKEKNGITMIALVITIIILLILGGISVSMLTGDNRIINRAGEAKISVGESEIIEKLEIAYVNVLGKINMEMQMKKN